MRPQPNDDYRKKLYDLDNVLAAKERYEFDNLRKREQVRLKAMEKKEEPATQPKAVDQTVGVSVWNNVVIHNNTFNYEQVTNTAYASPAGWWWKDSETSSQLGSVQTARSSDRQEYRPTLPTQTVQNDSQRRMSMPALAPSESPYVTQGP